MDYTRRSLLLIAVLALATTICSAQVITGTPPFGSFAGGPDQVNLANLNVHLNVPVFSRPGRGLPFNFYLTYDNSIWYPVTTSGTTTWTANGTGWGSSEVNVGSAVPTIISSTSGTCGSLPHLGITSHTTYGWNYIDGFGTRHPFSATSTMTINTCTGSSSTGFTGALAADLSGYSLSVTGITVVSIYSADGNLINAGSIEDRNGNEITVSSGVFTDTLGTVALTVSGSGTSASPTVYTYTPPNTSTSKCSYTNAPGVACYTVYYTNYTLATNFGISTIHEGKSSAAVPLITRIVQADGTQYTFFYEVTPSNPSTTACTPYAGTTCTTGRITQVNFPTGGTINYWYTEGNNGVLPDGSTATLHRQPVGDGTWTYAQSKTTGVGSTTTVTDPSVGANQTVLNFQGIYETFRESFQGPVTSGVILHNVSTCYNGNFATCGTAAVAIPITERTVFDTDGQTGPQCEHNYLYNASGGMTEQDDYDYGPSAPGALLRKTVVSFASLGNIRAFRQIVTICKGTGSSTSCNGTGTPVAVTNYNYDQGTLQPTTGITQHASISGSRGNLTSINYPVTGLTANFTYFDTGVPYTSQDVNGALTTYQYSATGNAYCNWAFPTKVVEPLSLTRSMTWNCTGGVQLTATDENSQVTSTTYSDPYFWRPVSIIDQENNSTGFYYGTNPMTVVQELFFNSNQSVADTNLGFDGLGRQIVTNHLQSPSSGYYDQVVQSFDTNGRLWKTSAPCVTTGAWTCPTTAQTITYDPLNRPSQVTDAGGGTTTYTYPQNDILITVGPAPGSENTKSRQLEYDALGRLTSVCELTSMTGSGTCGQNSPQTGYWTRYTYDALGDLVNVTQNAQGAIGTQQTRNYAYDAMGRLTSETNPESGTTTYGYDSVSGTLCAASSPGDLIKKTDANGNYTCFNYDALHRVTDVGNNNQSASNPAKRFRYDNTSGYAGSTKPAGILNTLGRLAEAVTDAVVGSDSIVTDEWFSYTPRGEVSDVYELTPHSSPTYYHVSQTYWPNGGPNVLAATNIGLPTITYGAEGEGRPSTVSASTGQNPVTAANYYNLYQSPYQMSVTFGSGDFDVFSYDPNTFRMNKYQFNVGSQIVTGTLGWNANWSLGSLGISDPFSTANTQTCNYTADDLARISSVSCGTIWGQSFAYDPFGNIQKTGTPGTGGSSFLPTYQYSPFNSNRVSTVGGVAATYDANGNSLNDTFRAYTWNAYNNPITIGSSLSLIYDAFDRMVDQSVSGVNSEIVYSPTGAKLALMNGTALAKAFVPLPGGATAVYTSASIPTIAYYRHTDHLGSSRFASTTTQTLYSDTAYSPFGEPYASSGALDNSFTGQNQDTTAGLYDFLYREHDPMQSRWTSPDPAGLASADPGYPQSWNRYAYVRNNPMVLVDQLGMYIVCSGGVTFDEVDFYVDGHFDGSDYTYIGNSCGGNTGGGGAIGGGSGAASGSTGVTTAKVVACASAAAVGLFSNNGGGTNMVGVGGTGALGVGAGISGTATVQVAGYPDGTLGVVASVSSNVGLLPTYGWGGNYGVAVSSSSAASPAQVEGPSVSASAGAGPISGSVSGSNSSVTTTIIAGPGFGGRGAGKVQAPFVVNGQFGQISIPASAQKVGGGTEVGTTKTFGNISCTQALIDAASSLANWLFN
jgi:RHS repeat-associated protein